MQASTANAALLRRCGPGGAVVASRRLHAETERRACPVVTPSRPAAAVAISSQLCRLPQLACRRAALRPAAAAGDRSSEPEPAAPAPAPAAAAAAAPSKSGALQGLKVTFYIFLWYAFNIVFNLLNKSTLNIFPGPWFLATFQLVASALFMVLLWATRLQPVPQVSWRMIRALLPVALFHTIGHVSACLSFSQMAVSFAHVVKSAEPVLSVVLAQAILGETYPYYVWLSLLPIIAGCSLSAMKEVSFAWGGFNNAMISNVGMVLRNIYSKKSLGDFKIDGINLFALLSIISVAYCLPCAVIMEGSKWPAMWEAGVAAAGGAAAFWKLLIAGGIFYHLYNQASYMVLDQGISPVTFSVGNTMKRVAVVVSSVLFFRNPVSALNWVGSMVAMLGTGLYSLAKQKAAEEAKAKKAAAATPKAA